jgi:hypothetical protein
MDEIAPTLPGTHAACHRRDLFKGLVEFQAARLRDWPLAMNTLECEYLDLSFADIACADRARMTDERWAFYFPKHKRRVTYSCAYQQMREDNHRERQIYIAEYVLTFLGLPEFESKGRHPRANDKISTQDAWRLNDMAKRRQKAIQHMADLRRHQDRPPRMLLSRDTANASQEVKKLLQVSFEETSTVTTKAKGGRGSGGFGDSC